MTIHDSALREQITFSSMFIHDKEKRCSCFKHINISNVKSKCACNHSYNPPKEALNARDVQPGVCKNK